MKTNPLKGLRQYSRIPFHADVVLQLHDRSVTVRLIDIAFKGALIQSSAPLALVPLEECRLLLSLVGGGEPIVMVGNVVHQEDLNVGIECHDMDVASLTTLRRLIELNTGDADLMNRELLHLFAT